MALGGTEPINWRASSSGWGRAASAPPRSGGACCCRPWPAPRLPIYAVAAYGVAVVDLAQLLWGRCPARWLCACGSGVRMPDLRLARRHRQRRPLLLALSLLLPLPQAAGRLHLTLGKARWLDGDGPPRLAALGRIGVGATS